MLSDASTGSHLAQGRSSIPNATSRGGLAVGPDYAASEDSVLTGGKHPVRHQLPPRAPHTDCLRGELRRVDGGNL